MLSKFHSIVLVKYLTVTRLPPLVNRGELRATILLVNAPLQNFYFLLRWVLLCYRWNYMEAISLPQSLCGLGERWDCGIKPTCFASSQYVYVVWLCAFSMHTQACVCVCMLVDIRAGMSVKLTSASGSSVWIICPWRDRVTTHKSANSSLVPFFASTHPLYLYLIISSGLLLLGGFIYLDFMCVFVDWTFFLPPLSQAHITLFFNWLCWWEKLLASTIVSERVRVESLKSK